MWFNRVDPQAYNKEFSLAYRNLHRYFDEIAYAALSTRQEQPPHYDFNLKLMPAYLKIRYIMVHYPETAKGYLANLIIAMYERFYVVGREIPENSLYSIKLWAIIEILGDFTTYNNPIDTAFADDIAAIASEISSTLGQES